MRRGRNSSTAGIAQSLTRQDVKTLLERARETFPHETCLTCECSLGYVAQLSIDAGEDVRSLLTEMGSDRAHAHGCPGCEPCPPAGFFAQYLKEQNA